MSEMEQTTNTNNFTEITIPSNAPINQQAATCPNCGYCPCCGRSSYGVYPTYPIYPWYQPYPYPTTVTF